MIRGGDGDDYIKGGLAGSDGTAHMGIETAMDGNGAAAYHYLYGDKGNDQIWGEDFTTKEKIWGGEGNDTIHGSNALSSKDTEHFLFGNAGNDVIYAGSVTEDTFTDPMALMM